MRDSATAHPFDHNFWSDPLDFILEHRLEGEIVSASSPFRAVLPEGVWRENAEGFGDWLVVHKGELDWMHFRIAQRIIRLPPVFANEVFVVFAPGRPEIPTYDGLHYNSLKKELNQLLAGEYVFKNRKALEETSRNNASAVGLGGGKVLCKILGQYKMVTDMRALEVAPHLIQDGFWESWITLAIFRNLPAGGYFVDVGANTGYYTTIFAAMSGDVGQTLAVEPQPQFKETLEANCIMNGCYGHWTVVSAAAGDEVGTIPLWCPEGYYSSAYLSEAPVRPSDKALGTVPIVVLDDVLRGWPRVDVVKIDVEGANDLVWAGLKETRQRPETLYFVEYVSSHERDRVWLEEARAEGFEVGYVNHRGEIVHTDPPVSKNWIMLVLSHNLRNCIGGK